jgi:Mg2+/citrate symporter
MADLITLIIAGMFGVVSVLFVSFFILIRQRNREPRFETQDYYKSHKRNDGYASRGNPFKHAPQNQDRREQPPFAVVSIALVVIGIVVSIFFDMFVGFLIIFSLPIVVRFIRMRSEANSNQNKARHERRSSY